MAYFDFNFLNSMFPATEDEILNNYVDPLNSVCDTFAINTDLRIAGFISQVGHESGGLRLTKENLNYSAERLRVVFPKYFPTDALAASYARQPEKIANRVYASRIGNGPEGSGDGWRFRGRGLMQLTGRANYTQPTPSRCRSTMSPTIWRRSMERPWWRDGSGAPAISTALPTALMSSA